MIHRAVANDDRNGRIAVEWWTVSDNYRWTRRRQATDNREMTQTKKKKQNKMRDEKEEGRKKKGEFKKS